MKLSQVERGQEVYFSYHIYDEFIVFFLNDKKEGFTEEMISEVFKNDVLGRSESFNYINTMYSYTRNYIKIDLDKNNVYEYIKTEVKK